MRMYTPVTEKSFEMFVSGDLAGMTAHYDHGMPRLGVTRHEDGTVTIRIGRIGEGPKTTISPKAAQALAGMLTAREVE